MEKDDEMKSKLTVIALKAVKHNKIIKRKLLNILSISSIITILGVIADRDSTKPNMLMRFVEFFVIIGIIFSIISIIYFTSTFIR